MSKFKILDNGLTINKISKSFGNKKVVRDVSLNIHQGEIIGLLGPNGAGKTTTFYIIVGLLKPEIQYRLKSVQSPFHHPIHPASALLSEGDS